MFQLLIELGADPHVRGERGNMSLYFAVLKGYVDLSERLIEFRVDLDC